MTMESLANDDEGRHYDVAGDAEEDEAPVEG